MCLNNRNKYCPLRRGENFVPQQEEKILCLNKREKYCALTRGANIVLTCQLRFEL